MNPQLKKKKRQTAQAMIEFALIFPLLIFLIYGLMEMGRLLFIYVSVVNASREASRFGSSVGNAGAYRFSDCNGILNAARRNAILNTIDPGNMAISYDTGPGTTPYATACSTAIDNIVALGDRINVTVTITYSPLMPVNFATFPVSATSSRTIIRGVEVVGANVDLPGVPTVTFSADGPTPNPVDEHVGTLTFQVLLDPSTTDTVTVPLTVSGDATQGQDFTIDTTLVTFVPGDSTETVTITIIDNCNGCGLDEYDETFVVTMGTPTNANKGTPNTYTVTIADNDDPPQLFFAAAASSGNEGTTQSIAVSLSAVSGKDISFSYDFIEASSDASAGLDFDIGPSSPITIPAGTAGATLQAVLEADGLYELDENAMFQLLSIEVDPIDPGTPTATIVAPDVHDLTIVNTDPEPQISWEIAASTTGENIGTLTLRVRIDTLSAVDSIANLAVDPATTATAGSDYVLPPGVTVTIPAGQLFVDYPIQIVDDVEDVDTPAEPAETLILDLSPADANVVLGPIPTHTVTIIEDASEPDVYFSPGFRADLEDTNQVAVFLALSNAWTSDVTVNLSVGGTMQNGVDYTLLSPTNVTIPAGFVAGTVLLQVVDDPLDEDNETLILTITSASGATPVDPSQFILTIEDNDDAPTIAFAQASSSYEEGTPGVSIDVVLSAASARTVQVSFAVTGGTATPGVDYSLLTASPLIFPAGTTSLPIDVVIPDDDTYTGTRNVVLSLSGAVNATPVAPQSHDLSIIDNEVCPTVTNLVFNDDQISTIVALATGATPTSIQEMTVTFDDSGTQVFHSVFLGTGGTSLIFSGGETASPVTITDGGTPGWVAGGVRTLNGGEGKVLLLVFQDGISVANRSSYGIDILWSNGCTASKP